jgi:hypothetical protein
MIGELNLFGIYIPWVLLLCVVALLVARAVSFVIARFGWYRFVWHPALFDLAVFIILLGGFTFLLPNNL